MALMPDAMTGERVLIAVGGNVGYAARMVQSAFRKLRSEIPGVEAVATSAMYETDPCYFEDQENFVNGVIELRTTVEPSELLNILKNMEAKAGRIEGRKRNGPRPLDLDILLYGDTVIDFPEETRDGKICRRALIIPHCKMHEREFVLYPLLDIDPDLRHPILGKTVKEILCDLKKQKGESPSNMNLGSSVVRRVCPLWGLGEQSKGKPLWKVEASTPLIMGVLHVPPDSFSHTSALEGSRGEHNPELEDLQGYPQNCIDEAFRMKNAGVDIVNVGGESARPGTEPTPVEVQLGHVIPVIRALTNDGIGVPISIDTSSAIVAREALKAGATIVNDVSAGRHDPNIVYEAADANAVFVSIHTRGISMSMDESQYCEYEKDPVKEVYEDLEQSCSALQRGGVAKWMHIIDPGFGFAKKVETNDIIADNLHELKSRFRSPVLVGLSRKRGDFCAKIPIAEKGKWAAAMDFDLMATIALSAVIKEANIMSVHNVSLIKKIIDAKPRSTSRSS
eukprot:376777_1